MTALISKLTPVCENTRDAIAMKIFAKPTFAPRPPSFFVLDENGPTELDDYVDMLRRQTLADNQLFVFRKETKGAAGADDGGEEEAYSVDRTADGVIGDGKAPLAASGGGGGGATRAPKGKVREMVFDRERWELPFFLGDHEGIDEDELETLVLYGDNRAIFAASTDGKASGNDVTPVKSAKAATTKAAKKAAAAAEAEASIGGRDVNIFAVRVRLGRQSLFGSSCVAIIHYIMDKVHTCPMKLWN